MNIKPDSGEPYKLTLGGVVNYWSEHSGTACCYPDVIYALYELGYHSGKLAGIEKAIKINREAKELKDEVLVAPI